jgi:hypothetical protein
VDGGVLLSNIILCVSLTLGTYLSLFSTFKCSFQVTLLLDGLEGKEASPEALNVFNR